MWKVEFKVVDDTWVDVVVRIEDGSLRKMGSIEKHQSQKSVIVRFERSDEPIILGSFYGSFKALDFCRFAFQSKSRLKYHLNLKLQNALDVVDAVGPVPKHSFPAIPCGGE